jgi:hypothetical protein|tara:strand:+ start:262 stop:1263 length:1002 start_codon:yes stop_codon:yes gene_type:complete
MKKILKSQIKDESQKHNSHTAEYNDNEVSILKPQDLKLLNFVQIHKRMNTYLNPSHIFKNVQNIQTVNVAKVEDERERHHLTSLNKERKHVIININNKNNVSWNAFFSYIPFKLEVHYLMQSFESLLERFLLLEDKYICYLQFSQENISFDDAYTPIVDGFYHAFQLDKIEVTEYRETNLKLVDIDCLSFELFYMISVLDSSNIIKGDDIIKLYLNKCYFLSFMNVKEKNVFYDDISMQFKRYKTIKREELLLTIAKEWKTWNLLIISSCYLAVLNSYIDAYDFKHVFWSEWINLLKSNLSPDPTKRYNISQMLLQFKNLKKEVDNWQSVISS